MNLIGIIFVVIAVMIGVIKFKNSRLYQFNKTINELENKNFGKTIK